MLVNIYITDFFCFYITSEFGWDWAITIGTIEASIFTVVVTGLFSMMVRCLGATVKGSEILPLYKMLKGKNCTAHSYHNKRNKNKTNHLLEKIVQTRQVITCHGEIHFFFLLDLLSICIYFLVCKILSCVQSVAIFPLYFTCSPHTILCNKVYFIPSFYRLTLICRHNYFLTFTVIHIFEKLCYCGKLALQLHSYLP